MKTITRKSLLYKSKVEFEDFCLNHIQGCTHNCQYPCFARLIKKATEEQWQQVALVSNTLALLEKEIPKYKAKIQCVHLCFSTDPFMYQQPEVESLSLQVMQRLFDENIAVKILTKGVYPVEKIVLMEQQRCTPLGEELKPTHYGISLVSLDESFRQDWEPGASSYHDRLTALKQLADAGLSTYIYCEPFSPRHSSIQAFRVLLQKIAFVDTLYFGSWQYNTQYADKSLYRRYQYLAEFYCRVYGIDLEIKKEIAGHRF